MGAFEERMNDLNQSVGMFLKVILRWDQNKKELVRGLAQGKVPMEEEIGESHPHYLKSIGNQAQDKGELGNDKGEGDKNSQMSKDIEVWKMINLTWKDRVDGIWQGAIV